MYGDNYNAADAYRSRSVMHCIFSGEGLRGILLEVLIRGFLCSLETRLSAIVKCFRSLGGLLGSPWAWRIRSPRHVAWKALDTNEPRYHMRPSYLQEAYGYQKYQCLPIDRAGQ